MSFYPHPSFDRTASESLQRDLLSALDSLPVDSFASFYQSLPATLHSTVLSHPSSAGVWGACAVREGSLFHVLLWCPENTVKFPQQDSGYVSLWGDTVGLECFFPSNVPAESFNVPFSSGFILSSLNLDKGISPQGLVSQAQYFTQPCDSSTWWRGINYVDTSVKPTPGKPKGSSVSDVATHYFIPKAYISQDLLS